MPRRIYISSLFIILLLVVALRYSITMSNDTVAQKKMDIGVGHNSYPIIDIPPERDSIFVLGEYFVYQTSIENITVEISIENTTFLPGITRNLTITIRNNGTAEAGPFGLYVKTPYFLVASEYMVLKNSTGNYTVPFEYVTINPVGNVSSNDTLTIYLPLEGVYGANETGILNVVVYRGEESISTTDIRISMLPMFRVDAYLEDRVLNISYRNYTTLHIAVRNIFPVSEDTCYVRNLSIDITSTPTLEIEPSSLVIAEINNTAPPTNYTFRIEVGLVDVYELVIHAIASSAYLKDANKTIEFPGEAVVRKILITTTEKIIIFDEGHEQYYRFASGYMKGLLDIASSFGPVLINHGEFRSEILDPNITSLVIIPNPEAPGEGEPIFTDGEVSLLQGFLEEGGAIILMGNWYQYFWPSADQNGYDAITGKYGIYWIDGDVYDNTSNFGRIYDVRVTNFANNTIARLMTVGVEYVRFSGTALNITNSTADVPVEIYPVLLGDNDTFVTLGSPTDPHVVDGTNVTMAVVAIINGSGRLFACGSSYMFSDYYYFGDNTVFIENLFYWIFSAMKLDMVISTEPYVYVGSTHRVTVEITNRGVTTLSNVTLTITPQEGLTYLNKTEYRRDLLEPGESWTLHLDFRADKPGDFYVRFVLSADEYPEDISRIVFLSFRSKGVPITYIAIGIAIVVIAVVVIKEREKIREAFSKPSLKRIS